MKSTSILMLSAIITLCTASGSNAQDRNPTGVDPTHYECYRVTQRQPLPAQTVKLGNQFGTSEARLGRAILICVPTEKNGEPIKDKETHLVCYTIEGRSSNKRVNVTHQFGKQVLAVGAPAMLCLPSLKEVLQ